MKYTRELLTEMYKDGLLSSKVVYYFDIAEKVKSLPIGKLSTKVRIVAEAIGINKQTVYRALRLFK